ncbi:acetylornithine deacetylase [Thiohalobacter sp. IOR34]|uniref:acetylornithine deacetylase n=1 Tax=Thiohalobacter sp. IOR34 TaxID=3057176 RepID=UPI0025B2616F|nr:acetylornithine deacetylase [Thiohalobacter sp. IOR34]WJW75170.1 acetylornithine deacetylase [Thiohalobacter sp. IOR34]
MTAPGLLQMIADLIAAPSVSSVNPAFDQGNLAVVERLESWLQALGFRTERMPLPGRPDKANLIATLGTGPGGLVLAGHTDTVPFDAGRWQQDPFRLTEADGRLYGLGTADMKAFLALAIEAARDLEAGQLKAPLIILATADEESSMAGARALVEAGRPRARHALIGEPTGLRPVRLHKGIMMEAIRLRGRAGHSSDPALGNSALEGMHRVMGALLAWRDELQASHRNPLFAVPSPTLNLGHIHGGDNPNRICAECELHIDLRPLPGMALEALRGELRQRLEAALAGSGLILEITPLFEGTPAMETAATADIVRTAETLSGHAAEAVAFGTEGPYLNQLGMDTVILGPGDIDQAHQADEYLALERIPPTLDLLRALIRRYCLGEAGS